ncbi:MAG: hypothetical protein ABI475_07430 [Methylophilaceae bacterium]
MVLAADTIGEADIGIVDSAVALYAIVRPLDERADMVGILGREKQADLLQLYFLVVLECIRGIFVDLFCFGS